MSADGEQLYREMDALLDGKPIELVAPLLVIAVARALVLEASGDMGELIRLLLKFQLHLNGQIDDMLAEGEGETRK